MEDSAAAKIPSITNIRNSNMARILILIGGHLCTAPRPQKEAEALALAGHDVMVAGVWFEPQLVARDQSLCDAKSWQFQPILDFRGITTRQKLIQLKVRLQVKFARAAFRRWKRCSVGLLGYGAVEMLQFAQNYRADLTIVHSEAGLWVGQQLLQQGYRIGVDFEDWFSQDLLPKAQTQRPIAWLKTLEATLARNCHYCLVPSQAMAMAIATAYDCPIPTVVYNAFPIYYQQLSQAITHDRSDRITPSLHWFSQTIGPGRGLETLFKALPLIQGLIQIHLRGNCPPAYQTWLQDQLPADWRDRFFVHDTVNNQELPARIAEHDIGLALETATIPSRDLTVTNKIFQYLEAGLAIIATDTTGQKEVLQICSLAGQLVASDDAPSLAAAINHWIAHPDQLAIAKQAATRADEALNWKTQADRLVQQAAAALLLPV
jgi:glycosyltransferase involved in cell wall biosynthesis